MLSPISRYLAIGLVALYGVLGLILFVAPNWGSGNFAWRVSPFVTMTIGGWCLGNAWCAAVILRRQLGAATAAALYLGLFGILQTIVLIMFRERVLTGNWLAWIYIATLVANCAFAVSVLIDVVRQRSSVLRPVGRPLDAVELFFIAAFIVGVGYLGASLFFGPDQRSLIGRPIFPEALSLFTKRSFGALYLSLSLSAVLLLFQRGLTTALVFAVAGYGLIVFITVAAFVFIGLWDFGTHPTQLIYIGLYLLVGVGSTMHFIRFGIGRDAKV